MEKCYPCSQAGVCNHFNIPREKASCLMDCIEADCRSFYGMQDPRQPDFFNCTRYCSSNDHHQVGDGPDWTKQHNNTCWCSVINDRLTKDRGYIAREMICV